ncbi:MAG: general secretion pathway protein GspK, partial [Pirellulales bacterium]|nr:general secretion pathway protein GspK [Pirellulales bacterium]
SPRRAMVLIIVLVVVAALSLAALAFSSLMISEREVTHTTGRQIQAMAMAESGIEAARQFLAEEPDLARTEGDWYSNAERFQAIMVVDDAIARDRGRFSIVAPGVNAAAGEIRFGLECESAKINLNTLLGDDDDGGSSTDARNRLMSLPNMTEELADAILDWLDADDDPREFGAEADYYQSLDAPYRPANGPVACLEELLYVRGVTPSLLYGNDRNRNGILDADESAGSASSSTDSSGTSLGAGWSAYLTLFSRENLLREDGQPKINLNQDDAETLHEELEEALGVQWARFIVGYRQQEELYTEDEATDDGDSRDSEDEQDGQQNTEEEESVVRGQDPASAVPGATGGKDDSEDTEEEYETIRGDGVPDALDLSKPLRQKIDNVLDLIGCRIQIKQEDKKRIIIVEPMFPNETAAMRDYLPKLFDQVATDDEKTAAGRVNVNLAAAEALVSVPGLDAALAEQIVAQRPTNNASPANYQRNATWLLVDGLVSLDQMKTLLPYLTAGGGAYQVQSIGFFDDGGPAVRLSAVLDATESPPRMLSLRNLTPLGRGFSAADLGAPQQ